MARISCGHCGGVHTSVAEVRACSSGDETTITPAVEPETLAGVPIEVDAAVLAGPDCLGRSILLTTDQTAPDPWAESPEVTVDCSADKVDAEVVETLQRAWSLRERLVIRLVGDIPTSDELPLTFEELSPQTEIGNERLRFLLTANTINFLGADPAFLPFSLAVAAGAMAPTATSSMGRGGDVELPDGSRAWADGGPLDLGLVDQSDLGGAEIIPRPHLIAGSIRPMRSAAGGETNASYDELAADQRSAVEHRGGPARILAPAGSGKTRVLTERVRFLVDSCGVEPTALGLVAYNRRAKAEMSSRLAGTGRYHLDSIRTLNSLALAIAVGRGGFVGGTPATTIDEREMRHILGGMMPRQRRRQLNDPLEPWIDALSMTRLGLRDPDEVADQFGGDLDGFRDVFVRYRQHLANRNLLDFDEQIVRALEILAGDRTARDQARRLMPLVLIDEFQDLTPAHLLLIRLIAGPANEVFAVGDDDQTIYSYSGASPRWLIDFDQFFPGAASHFLTMNYRCPVDVVTAADNLLSHNRQRVEKTITAPTSRVDLDKSSSSDTFVVMTKGDPQENLVHHVEQLLAKGTSPGDIAVLARVNAALLPAMMFLLDAGIPIARPAGVNVSMLDRSGAGAVLAWLRLATAPKNGLRPDDLRLALRRPPRSVHPRIVDWICEQQSVWHLEKLADRLNTERDAASVLGLASDIADLQEMAAGSGEAAQTESLVNHVLYDIGLLGAAGQLDGSQRTARRAAHSDELQALLAVARLHPDPETFEEWLRDRMVATAAGSESTDAAAVTLATVHTTKGLEWPHVIVHDVRDGLYPHRLAEDIEEERRIFHVAITRGRDSVALTGSGPRSPFVAELDDKRTDPWPTEPTPVLSGGARRSTADGGKGRSPGSAGSAKPKRAEPETADEARLRESLTDWRRQRAKSDAVPAYVVLNNKTLDAIAASAPQTLVALSAVPGIGPSRLEQYGDEILGVVAAAG